jgi:hypothetical protein
MAFADVLVHIIAHARRHSIQQNHTLVLMDYFDLQSTSNFDHHDLTSNLDHHDPMLNLKNCPMLVAT